jgi:aspartyl-tRNA(Asn)/glutamyl-tRNA(Gln) amidotransferase subunit A
MGSHSTHSFFGTVHNALPFENLSPGGSSGGSAVAVASGQCSIALGTDTGGSVRLPAAYTGIFGFKPSYGVISRWGVIPYANSMDTVGIIASDVKAIKRTLFRIQQHDPKDPTSLSDGTWRRLDKRRKSAEKCEARVRAEKGDNERPISREQNIDMFGVRIGVPLEYNIAELEPGIRQAWSDCLMSLQGRGATIVPVSLPNTKHALSAYYVLAPAEAASNLAKYDGVRYGNRDSLADGIDGVLYSRTRGNGFGDEVKRRILLGSYTLSSEAVDNYFLKAQKVRRLVQRDFDRTFAIPNPLRPAQQFDLGDMDESILMSNKFGPAQVDYIICPTAPTLPPALDDLSKQTPVDNYMNDVFTVPASLAGIPAMSIPFPISENFCVEGKPTFAGMQIIGQYASDYELMKIAEVLVKDPMAKESISPTPETATEPWARPIVWDGQASMSAIIERYAKLVKAKTRKYTTDLKPFKGNTGLAESERVPNTDKLRISRYHYKSTVISKNHSKSAVVSKYYSKPTVITKYCSESAIISKYYSASAVQTPASYNSPEVPDVPIYKQLSNTDPAPETRPNNFLVRKFPSDKGNLDRRPQTDKEVNKVFEDALGLWVEQHQNVYADGHYCAHLSNSQSL